MFFDPLVYLWTHKQALYCSGHREPEMVDVVYKRCEFAGGCEKVRKSVDSGHECFFFRLGIRAHAKQRYSIVLFS